MKRNGLDWRDFAKCDGEDEALFFGVDADGAAGNVPGPMEATRAKFCTGCPVQRDCLEEALTVDHQDDWGVWGGTTREQRKAIRKLVAHPARSIPFADLEALDRAARNRRRELVPA